MKDLDKLDYNQEWIDDKRKQGTIVRIYENFRQR